MAPPRWVDLLSREPFRIFFPAGLLSGIVGVALWPLHFLGLAAFYPGISHTRIMAYGFFGGFIFGFLGTAMPRMLSAQPFTKAEVATLLAVYAAMVSCFALSFVPAGDVLFLITLAFFIFCVSRRLRERKDLPPPGFVLVALSFLCVGTGGVLAVLQNRMELDPFWIAFQRLLSSQGFVLLPILGIAPFLLPRFFGMPSAHDLPESMKPTTSWLAKASRAAVAGALIILSFYFEASGSFRFAYGVRFAVTFLYMAMEFPFAATPPRGTVAKLIWVALTGILAGFLAVTVFPAYRVSLLHLTLIGGFSLITFLVATRVVFGHSGNLQLLSNRNRWLWTAAGLMLFGMATRISGDFWPKIMASHYIYGAISWIAGVIIWAVKVLPKVLVEDAE